MVTQKVTTEVVTVTPNMAAQWLGTMRRNRHLSSARVKRLAQEIREGKWILTGETIIFDEKGKLINGQHRLQAILLAEKAVPTVVVRGVPEEAWDALDSGKSRSGYDVVVSGGSSGRLTAPTLRLIWQHELGVLPSRNPEHAPSNRDLAGMVDEYPGVIEAGQWANSRYHTRSAPAAFVYWMVNRAKDPVVKEAAARFFEGLSEGSDIKKGSAVLAAREVLFSGRGMRGSTQSTTVLAKLIKGWNAHLADQPVGRITWSPTDEQFPMIAMTKAEAGIATGAKARMRKIRAVIQKSTKKEQPSNA